ncbi:MAG TPA: flavodoxin domain-containing protein, partial [Virgibacillus sp.]|nr:flavodoxin domain-containing protein [Virgibacillus sp.]
DVQQLLAYDMIFVGVYTWADGELPLEAEDLFDEIHTLDFTGKVCGVFGSADSSYEDYGTAVEIMYEELEDAGATMVPDSIIVDLEPDEAELKQCEKMVATAIDMT